MDVAYHCRMRQLESELQLYEAERRKIEADNRIQSAIRREIQKKNYIELREQLYAIERQQVEAVKRNVDLLQRLDSLEQQLTHVEVAVRVAKRQRNDTESDLPVTDQAQSFYDLRRVSSLSALPPGRSSTTSNVTRRQLPATLSGSFSNFQPLFAREQPTIQLQMSLTPRLSMNRLADLQFPVLQSTKMDLPIVPDLNAFAASNWSSCLPSFSMGRISSLSPQLPVLNVSQPSSLRSSFANLANLTPNVSINTRPLDLILQPSVSPLVSAGASELAKPSSSDDFETLFAPTVDAKREEPARPPRKTDTSPKHISSTAVGHQPQAAVAPTPAATPTSASTVTNTARQSVTIVSPAKSAFSAVSLQSSGLSDSETENESESGSESESESDDEKDPEAARREAKQKHAIPSLNLELAEKTEPVVPVSEPKKAAVDKPASSNASNHLAAAEANYSAKMEDETPTPQPDTSRSIEVFGGATSARSVSSFFSIDSVRSDASDEPLAFLTKTTDLKNSDAYRKLTGSSSGLPQKAAQKTPRTDDDDDSEMVVENLLYGNKSSGSTLSPSRTNPAPASQAAASARISMIADDTYDFFD